MIREFLVFLSVGDLQKSDRSYSYFTLPEKEPPVRYPPGFQEDYIPVHGPTVAKIIEDRADGKI